MEDDDDDKEIVMLDDITSFKPQVKINGGYLIFDEIKNTNCKAICKIGCGNGLGTGFFCKIKNPFDNKKPLNVLLTCYHVLKVEERIINEIELKIGNDIKTLNIRNREKCYDIKLDYICIQILKEDNINEFLEIDENFSTEKFNKNRIYSFGYLDVINFDVGNIFEKKDYLFSHNFNTDPGWSGGPIFNQENYKVIGLHKGYNKKLNKNIGIFINSIYNNLIEKNINMFNNLNNEENSINRIIFYISKIIEFCKNNKKKIIIYFACIIFISNVIALIFLAIRQKKIEEELKKKDYNDKDFFWHKEHCEVTDSIIDTFTFNNSNKYRVCVDGANAEKGGKGGHQCVEHYFEKGSIIEYKLGGKKSGGKGGTCGCIATGKGHSGAGLSYAKCSSFYIVAGGGGGNSESGNKGGDSERKGEGKYGGEGATKSWPGKRGDRNKTNSEQDGNGENGGNARNSSTCLKYCGGGGGAGHYGGGAGDYGKEGEDGGGGGGSNYCQIFTPYNVKCLKSHISTSDCARLSIKKILVK